MDSDSFYTSELQFYNQKLFNDSKGNCTIHKDAINKLLNETNKGINVVLDESCKPFTSDMIEFQNMQKVDINKIDTFTTEKILSKYSVMGRTNRLVMKLWFFMIDLACLNSFVLYHVSINNNLSRTKFLKQLGLDLVNDQIEKRSICQYLPRELRNEAASFLGLKSVPKTFDKKINKPVRCVLCPRKADKKVRSCCHICEQPMYQLHMTSLCDHCLNME